MKKSKIYAISGILAPINSLVFIALLGYLIPGYNHISNMISELAAKGSQYAFLGNLSLIMTGILLLVFAKGLYLKLPKNNNTKIFIALISFFAVFACLGSATFPCEIENNGLNCPTKTHEIINGLALGALSLAPIMFMIGTKNASKWKSLYSISCFVQILGLIALSLFILQPQDLIGLLQRVCLGIYFLWIEILAIKLYLLAKRS